MAFREPLQMFDPQKHHNNRECQKVVHPPFQMNRLKQGKWITMNGYKIPESLQELKRHVGTASNSDGTPRKNGRVIHHNASTGTQMTPCCTAPLLLLTRLQPAVAALCTSNFLQGSSAAPCVHLSSLVHPKPSSTVIGAPPHAPCCQPPLSYRILWKSSRATPHISVFGAYKNCTPIVGSKSQG